MQIRICKHEYTNMNIKTQTCVGCGPPPVYVQAAAEVVTVCACHFVVFVIAMMHNMRSACCTDASRSRRKGRRDRHRGGLRRRTVGRGQSEMGARSAEREYQGGLRLGLVQLRRRARRQEGSESVRGRFHSVPWPGVFVFSYSCFHIRILIFANCSLGSGAVCHAFPLTFQPVNLARLCRHIGGRVAVRLGPSPCSRQIDDVFGQHLPHVEASQAVRVRVQCHSPARPAGGGAAGCNRGSLPHVRVVRVS